MTLMNKIIKTLALACMALLMMAACSDDLATDYGDDDVMAEAGYITLTLSSPALEAVTRATDGDDALNENVITVADLYFYTNDNTNNAIIVAQGRSVQATADNSKQYTVKVRLSTSERTALFGSGQTCRVYVVANSTDENPDATSTSINNVRARVLLTDFSARKVQQSFVMSGEGTVTLATVTGGYAATGTVRVTRQAAKLYPYVYVPDTLHVVNIEAGSRTIWRSVPTGIKVQLLNGVRKASIDGTYQQTDDDYFSTAQYDITTTTVEHTTDGTSRTYLVPEAPFYTYPSTWSASDAHEPVIIISVPWKQEYTDSTTVSYYQVHPSRIDRRIDRNRFYQIYCSINTIGSSDTTVPVEIDGSYTVMDWGKVDTAGEGDFSKISYLVVEPTEIEMDNITSTNINYASSSELDPTKTYVESVTYNTYTNGSAAVSHTLTHDGNDDLSAYSLDLSTRGTIVFSHSIADLDYVEHTITLLVTNTDGLSERVTITQRPPISIQFITGGNVFVDGYFGHVVAMGDSEPTGWLQETSNGVTYYYSAGYGGNVYDYGSWWSSDYSAKSSNKSVVPGPECVPYYSGTYSSYSRYGYGTVQSDLSQAGSSTGRITQTAITDITVSAFNADDKFDATLSDPYYKIGDPRVKGGYSSSDLQPYLQSQSRSNNNYAQGYYDMTTKAWDGQTTGTYDNAADILVGGSTDNVRSIIAPHFYISSGWNSSIPITYDNAKKRAATFQEAGYSAGRWRLPTEAEIMFITSLQEKGIITQLFGNNAPYWASSGRFYYKQGNNAGGMYSADEMSSLLINGTNAYTRLVYDAWYWGTDAGDPTQYHPDVSNDNRTKNPTQTTQSTE